MVIDRPRHLFTVDDYHRMAAAGILSEQDRVELIEGEIIEMSPIGDAHLSAVNRFNHQLSRQLAPDLLVSVQNPLRLGQRNEPQPDLAVFRPVGAGLAVTARSKPSCMLRQVYRNCGWRISSTNAWSVIWSHPRLATG